VFQRVGLPEHDGVGVRVAQGGEFALRLYSVIARVLAIPQLGNDGLGFPIYQRNVFVTPANEFLDSGIGFAGISEVSVLRFLGLQVPHRHAVVVGFDEVVGEEPKLVGHEEKPIFRWARQCEVGLLVG